MSLRATPGGHHLVVDEVGRQPGEGQVALALADDLVAGGEADEVGEALDRHGVAVADEVRDRVAHRWRPWMCSRRHHRRVDGPRRAGRPRDGQPATSATASPKSRRAVSISSCRDGQRRAHPDGRLAALEDEQAALEGGHWTASARVARVELDADHQALAADVADDAGVARRRAGRGRPSPGRRARAAFSTRPSSSSSIVASAAAQATGLPPYVEPWAPGPHAPCRSRPGDHRAERHARWRCPWP